MLDAAESRRTTARISALQIRLALLPERARGDETMPVSTPHPRKPLGRSLDSSFSPSPNVSRRITFTRSERDPPRVGFAIGTAVDAEWQGNFPSRSFVGKCVITVFQLRSAVRTAVHTWIGARGVQKLEDRSTEIVCSLRIILCCGWRSCGLVGNDYLHVAPSFTSETCSLRTPGQVVCRSVSAQSGPFNFTSTHLRFECSSTSLSCFGRHLHPHATSGTE